VVCTVSEGVSHKGIFRDWLTLNVSGLIGRHLCHKVLSLRVLPDRCADSLPIMTQWVRDKFRSTENHETGVTVRLCLSCRPQKYLASATFPIARIFLQSTNWKLSQNRDTVMKLAGMAALREGIEPG